MEGSAAETREDGARERRRGLGAAGQPEPTGDERPQSGGTNGLPKPSYWLDLWLFVLFDLALFVFVYLLP